MWLTGEAMLIDLDGTLVDSTASVRRCWQQWAREYDVDLTQLRGTFGLPASAIVAALLPADRVEAALRRVDEIELADSQAVVAMPGALALLATVPDRRWAVVTSCTRPLAVARMAAAGIPAPAVLVTADQVRHGKPDPEPFLLAASRLHADPGRCVVVEDAPSGLQAARAAGMATVAVTTTHHRGQLQADLVVEGVDCLAVAYQNGSLVVGPAGGPRSPAGH